MPSGYPLKDITDSRINRMPFPLKLNDLKTYFSIPNEDNSELAEDE